MTVNPVVRRFSQATASFAMAIIGAGGLTSMAQAATPYSYTEDFEDGALNTPGLSVTQETANPGSVLCDGPFVDSVQGANPPFGSTGCSYYSGRANGNSAFNHKLIFSFDATVLGALPTKAGLTWTDVSYLDSQSNYSQSNGQGIGVAVAQDYGVFEAWSGPNATGTLLYTIRQLLGDGQDTGQTDEDTIFFWEDANGIGSVSMLMENSTDWEVDNITYSGVVPDAPTPVPTPALLPGLVGLGLGAWRKRRGA